MKQKLTALLLLLFLLMGLAGCTSKSTLWMGRISSSTASGMKASFARFEGTETRRIRLKKGNVTLRYQITAKEQQAYTLTLQDKQGNVLVFAESPASGETNIAIETDGDYDLILAGEKVRNGSYDISWEKKQ